MVIGVIVDMVTFDKVFLGGILHHRNLGDSHQNLSRLKSTAHVLDKMQKTSTGRPGVVDQISESSIFSKCNLSFESRFGE